MGAPGLIPTSMKLGYIAFGYVFVHSICYGMDQPADNENTVILEDFTDELILYCFSFMPAFCIARTATVSQRFNGLSGLYLRYLFQTKQEDNTYKPDPCKMFQYYHEVEQSVPIKALTLRTLKAERTTFLSRESFKNNSNIKFLAKKLFADEPVILYDSSELLDNQLLHLMIKYKDLSRWLIRLPTEKLIDAVGHETLRPMVTSYNFNELFFDNDEFVKGGLAFRRKLFGVLQDQLSPTLMALLESGDVFDSRLVSDEIGPIELITLSDFASDEKSIEKAIDLAARFIREVYIEQLARSIECIRNTTFVISMLRMRQLHPGHHGLLILILYMRPDAVEIFRGINDVEAIEASFMSADDSVNPMFKLVFGVLTGMNDDVLIPQCQMLHEGQDVIGSIAAYHKRSLALLRALNSVNSYFSHLSPRNLNKSDRFDYGVLDYDLEDNISLLEESQFYWAGRFISLPKRLEYYEYMLDNADETKILPVLQVLHQCAAEICTDEIYRKLIKTFIILGNRDILGVYGTSGAGRFFPKILLNEIEMEVKRLVRSGVDYSKMIVISPEGLSLGNLQKPVFEEVWSWENGFNLILGHLCANNGESLENNVLLLIKLGLLRNIGFPLPKNLYHLVFSAISDLMKNDTESCNGFVQTSLKRTLDASKLDPVPSPFHEAVAEMLSSSEYLEFTKNLKQTTD